MSLKLTKPVLDKASFLLEVEDWAKRIHARGFRVRVQPMKRKWASCSSRRNLTFSTELLAQKRSFRDYVIVHELLHLKVANHGKLFKSFLRAYLRSNPWVKQSSIEVSGNGN